MSIKKKALGIGMSAGLIASLFATAVAPSVLAAITVGSAGNVPVGGTSALPVSFTFTEQAVNSIPTNTAGSFTVTIAPAAPGAGSVSFVGIPSTAGSTGSLGASASIAGNVLTVNIAGSDTVNIESIFISGLKISAAPGTSTGAISATLSAGSGSLTGPAAIFSGGGTATGTLASGIGAGATSATVNVTSAGCPFSFPGTLTFATTPESVALASAGALTLGQQALTFTATANVHNANEVVSETNGCAVSSSLASPGTVVAALAYSSANNLTVYPGENNSPAANLTVTEPSPGFLLAGSNFTFTIQTPGVVFSTAPSVTSTYTPPPVDTITGNTVANPTVVTTSSPHYLVTGDTVTITGSNSTPTLNGLRTVTVLSATTFSVPVNVTTAGTTGTVTPTTLVARSSIGLSAPVISASRTSATVTVNTASTGTGSTITLSNILYDVSASVPAGTFISVGLATSGLLAVLPPSNTNAVVFRGIAATATSPLVYIGENNQAAGIISFTESSAGFFTSGIGTGTNTFWVCPTGVTFSFTLAPYAQVVGGTVAGNLILRDGNFASTTNIVQGSAVGVPAGCYGWTVWSASTTPSTIRIGDAGLTSGALINVTTAQAPGGVDVQLWLGSSNFVNPTLATTVQFATAMYRNQVAVTALSQPAIAPGSVHALAGSIQIAETGLGQLKAGESICIEVLPRSTVSNIQDTFLNALSTADLPVATASGTGLVIGPVQTSFLGCNFTSGDTPAAYVQSVSFSVLQQSTAGDGKLVINNINYTTTADAHLGTVLVSVYGMGGGPTNVVFHSTVSNAFIGSAVLTPITAANAVGLPPNQGPWSTATKLPVRGQYVTWQFNGGSSQAGKLIQIWFTRKNSAGGWGPFTLLTSRLANASGVANFWWKSSTPAWVSVRAYSATTGTWSAAVQARWR